MDTPWFYSLAVARLLRQMPAVNTALVRESPVEVKLLKRDEIRSGWLAGGGPIGFEEAFDVFLVPGGSSSKYSCLLGPSGRTEVRNFVRAGGGYCGVCAGAFLALSDWRRKSGASLDLVEATLFSHKSDDAEKRTMPVQDELLVSTSTPRCAPMETKKFEHSPSLSSEGTNCSSLSPIDDDEEGSASSDDDADAGDSLGENEDEGDEDVSKARVTLILSDSDDDDGGGTSDELSPRHGGNSDWPTSPRSAAATTVRGGRRSPRSTTTMVRASAGIVGKGDIGGGALAFAAAVAAAAKTPEVLPSLAEDAASVETGATKRRLSLQSKSRCRDAFFVDVRFSKLGRKLLWQEGVVKTEEREEAKDGSVRVRYHNGPLVVPTATVAAPLASMWLPQSPTQAWLAAGNQTVPDVPAGLEGAAAFMMADVEDGRAVLLSPHAESTHAEKLCHEPGKPRLRRILQRAVLLAASCGSKRRWIEDLLHQPAWL
jgi:hypothetical protein